MRQILYLCWASVLLALLMGGWTIAGFKPMEELKTQVQHVDDFFNSRGAYADRP